MPPIRIICISVLCFDPLGRALLTLISIIFGCPGSSVQAMSSLESSHVKPFPHLYAGTSMPLLVCGFYPPEKHVVNWDVRIKNTKQPIRSIRSVRHPMLSIQCQVSKLHGVPQDVDMSTTRWTIACNNIGRWPTQETLQMFAGIRHLPSDRIGIYRDGGRITSFNQHLTAQVPKFGDDGGHQLCPLANKQLLQSMLQTEALLGSFPLPPDASAWQSKCVNAFSATNMPKDFKGICPV